MISRGDQPSGNIIDLLLESQQQLTAVEKFSQRYQSITAPALETHYQDLIPLEAPLEGEQYSFEIDLDACSGCKACVAACHSLNGLEDGELWRNVGLLIGGSDDNPVVQHVTSSCHHCLEPACMHGCPVNAYEKDPVTGIVEHLDDQCIGCRYCMFTCPYDVPTYSHEKGIVRKCNMCVDRLRVGEAPACVQACPNQAIRIRTVSREEIINNSETAQLVPTAPDAKLTMPTTNYNTSRVMPRNLLPEDFHVAKPLHAHWPLVFMLTLTQMALGVFAVAFAIGQIDQSAQPTLVTLINLFGFLPLALGLGVASLHLGRPHKAYRALRGIRTSWLSREIAGFNLFAGAATAVIAWGVFGFLTEWFGDHLMLLSGITVVTGILAVTCSAMLYVVTGRPLWSSFRTHAMFFLTAAVLGISGSLLSLQFVTHDGMSFICSWLSQGEPMVTAEQSKWIGKMLCGALMVCVTIKLVIEGALFTHLNSQLFTPHRLAAQLLIDDLRIQTSLRFMFAVGAGLGLPMIYLAGFSSGLTALTAVMFGLLLVAELTERYLFFAISVARTMPGSPN